MTAEKQRYNFQEDISRGSDMREFQMESGMGSSPVTQTTIFKKLSKAKKAKLPNPVKVDLRRFQPLDSELQRVNGRRQV